MMKRRVGDGFIRARRVSSPELYAHGQPYASGRLCAVQEASARGHADCLSDGAKEGVAHGACRVSGGWCLGLLR